MLPPSGKELSHRRHQRHPAVLRAAARRRGGSRDLVRHPVGRVRRRRVGVGAAHCVLGDRYAGVGADPDQRGPGRDPHPVDDPIEHPDRRRVEHSAHVGDLNS
jgi:hypothetical protein